MTAAAPDVWIQPRTGQALQPADAAIEYLRRYCIQILPVYVVAMAPFSVVMFLLIDAISALHREPRRVNPPLGSIEFGTRA